MLLLTTLAALAPALHDDTRPAADWPQWRGPGRDGHAAGEAWPDGLSSERLATVWEVEGLGESYSGPIVVGPRVFTTATVDKQDEVVRAFDRATGKELWETRWAGSMSVPFFAARNGSWIRSTPAYDDGTLYVAGMRDVLVALDAETGEVEWRVDFQERYGTGNPNFGFVCSPLVVGDHVYVQAGAAFVKVDKRTGESVWRTLEDKGGMDSAFSSPVELELFGKRQLVVLSRSHLSGVDPADGGVLWSQPVEAFRGMNILTPIQHEGAVFTAPYGARAQLLKPLPDNEDAETAVLWNNRAQGYMTSPVIVGGHAYLFTRANRFHCIDLESGADGWISTPPGDDYWSLVAQGEHILALANTGLLRLIAADPEEYRVIGEAPVAEEPTWAHLAVVGRELYVRSQTGLKRLAWK